jgi:NitT/TauT family transport system substrate-binding protein
MRKFAVDTLKHTTINRRDFLRTSAGAAAAISGVAGTFVSVGQANSQGIKPCTVQYDWLIGNGQIGDIVAQQKGWFKEEGLEVHLAGGGPNAQTLPPLLTGQAQMGQMTSSQTLVAHGAGRPIKLFACGYQFSPYA